MLKEAVAAIWRNTPPSLRKSIVRTTQQTFTISVAAMVVNENDEILLLDHVLRPGPGWGIPGGFLAAGEQPADGVRRELFEETGIELIDVQLLQTRTVNRHVEILFRAKANGIARVKSREIKAIGWFTVDQMPENISRMQKSIIENLLKDNL